MDEYDGRQFVGIDLHRRRSVIVRMTETGERLGVARIDNDLVALGAEIAKAGRSPEVVLEATYGWYWAADVLAEAGARVHLAHPLGVKAFAHRRVKNDVRDATDLADLLRMGRLPEAYVAPPEVRELREQVRHRAKLVMLRSGLKAQVHAVLAKEGVHVRASDVFGVFGRAQLDKLPLGAPYRARVNSLLRLIDAYTFEIDTVTARLQAQLAGQPGYQALLEIPGVGPVLAGVFYAEIGQVRRFRTAKQLCSWAGLTPRHYESDTTVRRGSITKQGSALVRWAAIEAVQKLPADGGWLVANRARLLSAAAGTSPPWRPPASCSPWSTTACATGTSALSSRPRLRREQARMRPGAWPLLGLTRHGEAAHMIGPTRPRSYRSMPRHQPRAKG